MSRFGLKGWVAIGFMLTWGRVFAADVTFTAEVNQQRVTEDDAIALTLSISSEGRSNVEDVRFEAPDFQTVNQYTSSLMNSSYDSSVGRFSVVYTQKIIKVLKPVKIGHLVIRKIQARVDGKNYSASDIAVEVLRGGGGQPSANQPGYYVGTNQHAPRANLKNVNTRDIMVRAEVDKEHAYKGEQIILSYYLYKRVRMYGVQVDKFPELKGFLREEVQMPVMGNRLDSESVAINGMPYERSLLARYALYPLQDGKLKIDEMGLRYNYFSSNGDPEDDLDPFFQLFRQSQPRVGASRNDPVVIDVLPLPTEGRPTSFSGGVGSFSVVTAVDKYEVRANDAVTLTVKVEGKGNLASIGEPKAEWPRGLDLYDSKGKVNSVKGGVGSKVFEFVLIPRTPGSLVLPSLEFVYFDPAKKEFVTTHTDPITIQVLVGNLPTDSTPQPSQSSQASQASKNDEMRYLKAPSDPLGSSGILGWIYWMGLIGSTLLLGGIGSDLLRRWLGLRRVQNFQKWKIVRRDEEKAWDQLRRAVSYVEQSSKPLDPAEISKNYETMSALVFNALDRVYGVGARSLSRPQLKQLLVAEREMNEALWLRIEQILEFGELVRFSGSGSAISQQAASADLKKWVGEAESVTRTLDQLTGHL